MIEVNIVTQFRLKVKNLHLIWFDLICLIYSFDLFIWFDLFGLQSPRLVHKCYNE